MSDRRQKIVETVKKLLLHARSAEGIGNREEAIAFSEKVTALMREYRIEFHEVEPSIADATDFRDYGTSVVDGYLTSEPIPWQAFLYQIIAMAHACQCVFVKDDALRRFFIAGATFDRAVVCALSEQLCKSIERLGMEAAVLDAAVSLGYCTREEFMVSYRTGFMQALQERLTEAEAEDTPNALIAISRAVTKTEKYLQTRVSGVRGAVEAEIELTHQGAAEQGYTDGMAADVEANRLRAGRPTVKKEIA